MILKIENIEDVNIRGVRYALPGTGSVLQRHNFEWTSFPIETQFKTNRSISGILQGWHCKVEFNMVEYHDDAENFFFSEGTSLMLFCDKKNEKVDLTTAQIVRIEAGTQIEISPEKCHYVPIPETDYFKAFVFTPIQESVLLALPEKITIAEDESAE